MWMNVSDTCNVSREVSSSTMSKVVLRVLLILAEDLDGWGTGDSKLGGQVTVSHDINSSKSDVLTIMLGLLGSLLKLRFEGPAVRAEISVVRHNPVVILVVDYLVSKIFGSELLDVVVEGNGGSGEVCDSSGDAEELHSFFTIKVKIAFTPLPCTSTNLKRNLLENR